MKYSYHVPASSYTRASQYTPTHYTASNYTPTSHYTPTNYSSTYSSVAKKYSPTSYTPSYYTPSSSLSSSSSSSLSSHYTSPYKSTSSTYIPSYSKGSRYSSTRHSGAKETYAPVPVPIIEPVEEPPRRAVHFPNEIIFQDIVRRSDLEQIGRFMRARKVRVDTVFPSGLAPLHEAVLTGNLDVVKLLIRYGADVHQRDEDGWTPLHMACSDGYPEIARYLLLKGASTEAENEGGEKPGDLIDPECKDLVRLFEKLCV